MGYKFCLILLAVSMPLLGLAQSANSSGLPTSFSVAQKPFSAHLSLNKVEFDIYSPNRPSNNVVTITSQGIEGNRSPLSVPVVGQLTGAEVADLNIDGYPEIYIYLNTANSNAYGCLLAYASNMNKSITPIYIPSLIDDPKLSSGYKGHDEFSVVESKLMRRFPLGMKNSAQQYRQIQYRLDAGEAGWVLRPEQSVKF